MNFGTFLAKLKEFFLKLIEESNITPTTSLLIPFREDNADRKIVFDWLLRYWKHELPDAEIVIGHSKSKIFCKTEALNDAASRATGEVFVILDADAYLEGKVIEDCVDKILRDLKHHLWFVPYRHLYRLNNVATERVIRSDPTHPIRFPSPPPKEDLDDNGDKSGYGHRYAAMIYIIPREAYEVLGCFDERFVGWGGEDIATLRALDTLYGKHKTTKNDLLHLWHPKLGSTYQTRVWAKQKQQHPNDKLATRYHKATRHPSQMRELVNEGCKAHNIQKFRTIRNLFN